MNRLFDGSKSFIPTFQAVMNNGFASQLFEIKRGVRQGDPLPPNLFIIALEILNISIRENKEIIGIKVGNEEIKLNVFADDLTTFVKNTRSFFFSKTGY